MQILLSAVLLIGAPFVAATADSEPEPAASEEVPPKATGLLSPQEETFQGDWMAYDFVESDRVEYALSFEGRNFRARARPDEKDRDERYEGYIVIRADAQPAQIDFVVLDESGKPGRISKGIFSFDGETVIVKAPEHGLPRPQAIDSDVKGPIAHLRLSR